MSLRSINKALRARIRTGPRCKACRKRIADDQDDALVNEYAEREGRWVGGEGAFLCWGTLFPGACIKEHT